MNACASDTCQVRTVWLAGEQIVLMRKLFNDELASAQGRPGLPRFGSGWSA